MSDVQIERISATELAEMLGNEKKCECHYYFRCDPSVRIPCPNAAEYVVTRTCCRRKSVVCAGCAEGPSDCRGCGAWGTYTATVRKV